MQPKTAIRRLRRTLAVLAVVSLVAACGGDGASDTTAAPATTSSPTPETTAAAGETTTPASAGDPYSLCHPDGQPVEGVVIFNSSGGSYGEAVEEAYFGPFTEECGVEVQHVTDQRDYSQIAEMMSTGNVLWDIGGTRGDHEFPLAIEDGYLHKLPDGFWSAIEDDMNPAAMSEYGAWATPFGVSMVYNTDELPSSFGENGWADFWDVETYPGPRSLRNSPETFVLALMADGVSGEELYPLDFDRAIAKLDEIRDDVLFWWDSADQPVQSTATGEVVAGTTFTGRVVPFKAEGQPVEIAWNQMIWRESWNFILEGGPNTRNAEALLWFMQRPDRQAALAELNAYTGGNEGIAEYLEDDVLSTLPSFHQDVSVPYDANWWAENLDDAQSRWDAWLAG